MAVKKAPKGKLDDGGGLRLYKTETSGRWVYRYSIAGRRREMGLGPLDDVSLSDARKERDKWARVLSDGKDPISERDRQLRDAANALLKQDPTFAECAETLFDAKKDMLRASGERGKWFSPIRIHVLPKIGKRSVSTLTQADMVDVLKPIWRTKHQTALKVFNRTRMIIRHAKLSGYDTDPFIVEAARHMLGEVKSSTSHIVSTPWQEVPAVYSKLTGPGVSRLCLKWIILTGVRSESARGARFSEIDGDVWTIPASRMKGTESAVTDFRVPLSSAAKALLEEISQVRMGDFMFPSNHVKKDYISSTALAKVLNEIGEPGRPHGFRTSFRTWVQDTEAASFDVAETALAHTVGSKLERSYARSDLLDARAVLMDRWGRFVTQAPGDVISIRA